LEGNADRTLTNEHRVQQVRNHAAERLVVRRDDGIAGAINVNHRPCRGKQAREDAAWG